jgi:hypothetical protein
MSGKAIRVVGILALGGLLVSSQTGCLLVAAGAVAGGTVAYVRGDLEADVDGDVPRVVEASKAAMDDLKFPLLGSYAVGTEGKVEARVGADNKATINIEARTEKFTHVSIRIGTFGDDAVSQSILERIKANLKAPPAEDVARGE